VDLGRIKKQLMDHEGYGPKVYEDTVGILTIGYGRNLEDKGITEAEAEYLLVNDIREVENELRERLPFFRNLSSIRQEVLIDMGYNLGCKGLMNFRRMLAALEDEDYELAADEMLDSKWATQVKGRANNLAQLMREE
tara:strand:+ start:3458 stop:3868 length:411 start_codon:yes stop_codon:yes gene_type:complete